MTDSLRASSSILLLLLVMAGAAGASEEDPDVKDPAGDVNYSPAYPLPQESDYLDILAAWWDYRPLTDSVVVGLAGVDYSRFATDAQQDHYTYCRISTAEENSTVTFWFQISNFQGSDSRDARNRTDTFHTDVFVNRNETAGRAQTPLAHLFAGRFDAPGQLVFVIPRQAILNHADRLVGLLVNCREFYAPGAPPPGANTGAVNVGTEFMVNVDGAGDTNVSLDLRALIPVNEPQPPECELEGTCVDEPVNTSAPSSAEDGPRRSPGLPSASGLAMIAAMAWWLRRGGAACRST